MCGYLKGGERMVTATKTKKSLPRDYMAVARCIGVGKENAILMSDIMTIANIKDKRYAFTIIEKLINNHGLPIVASKKGTHRGYYYPTNDSEFISAITSLENGIESLRKRHSNLVDNYINIMYKNNQLKEK